MTLFNSGQKKKRALLLYYSGIAVFNFLYSYLTDQQKTVHRLLAPRAGNQGSRAGQADDSVITAEEQGRNRLP
jgi:hypothetical protein